MFDRLRYLFTGRPPARPAQHAPERPMSRVDAAETSDENRRHWANADAFSADAAYHPGVRYRLRNRSRYEVLNNSYAKGAVRAGACDLIGTGPRLQLTIDGDADGKLAKAIERSFEAWADECQLAVKLRAAEKSRLRDGECFGIFDTNERLRHPVKFWVRWVEAEMCGDPYASPIPLGNGLWRIDGITFDRLGLPVSYTFYTRHPGDNAVSLDNSFAASGPLTSAMLTAKPLSSISVKAENVVHWYDLDRFGQHRAIPETTPALPLYSQLRRYSLAVLLSSEFAASLQGILKTSTAPDDGNGTTIDRWELFEMVRGALLTLPEGWDANQFKAEQPATNFGDFRREILNEAGRATGQPLNVVTGNSSGYNFSSARSDMAPYGRRLRVERNDLRLIVLDPVFRAWQAEAALVRALPNGAPAIAAWRWTWNWDGFEGLDPTKDASADDTRLKNGTATYADVLSDAGVDWRDVFEQLAREKAYAEQLGLPWPLPDGTTAAAAKPSAPPAEQQDQLDDQESAAGKRNGQRNGSRPLFGGRS